MNTFIKVVISFLIILPVSLSGSEYYWKYKKGQSVIPVSNFMLFIPTSESEN